MHGGGHGCGSKSVVNSLFVEDGTTSVPSEQLREITPVSRQQGIHLLTPLILIRQANVSASVSEDVVLQLINNKCMPSLSHGLEACPPVKSDLSSLDFVVNRFFMKLFRTSSMDIVRDCQSYFGFKLPSELWSNRVKNVRRQVCHVRGQLCQLWH